MSDPFVVHQSDLKLWQRCPLQYKFTHIDKLPREQSGSLTFGSIIHLCTEHLESTGDLAGAVEMFHRLWDDPSQLGAEYTINYYVRGTNWKKYHELGPKLLHEWSAIFAWDSAAVLGRELHFAVPIGDGHVLEGTIDKLELRYLPKISKHALVIVDYKTNNKVPTYEYLLDDLQFSAYGYATTCPEFWTGIPNGEQLFRELANTPRWGEWVALTAPKRLDAGERTVRDYNRLIYAVNALAESVALRIFVPNISGESCRYCEFRKLCGLPELDENGQVA